jgi:Flp pilus assembly protein TadD
MQFISCWALFSLVPIFLALSGCTTHSPQPMPSLSGDASWRVAEAAKESGDYALAETIAARGSAATPRDALAQLRYADVLVSLGKLGPARDLLVRHLKMVSDPLRLRGALGAIYVLPGEAGKAIAEFDAVLASDPDNMRIVVNKAVAFDLLGRHDEAVPLYRRSLASAPNDAVVINDLALSLLLSGRVREAEEVAAPLRQQAGLMPRIKAGLGVVLAADGDLPGARDAIGSTTADYQLIELAKAASRATGH